jgi:hypothetical protein
MFQRGSAHKIHVYIEMIAQEVMQFKAQKQGLPPLQLNTATNLRRKDR